MFIFCELYQLYNKMTDNSLLITMVNADIQSNVDKEQSEYIGNFDCISVLVRFY